MKIEVTLAYLGILLLSSCWAIDPKSLDVPLKPASDSDSTSSAGSASGNANQPSEDRKILAGIDPEEADFVKATLARAKIFYSDGRYEDVYRELSLIKTYIEDYPGLVSSGDLVSYRHLLAQTMLQKNNLDEGLIILADIVSQRPAFTPAYVSLANALMLNDEFNRAELVLNVALNHAPNNPDLLVQLAIVTAHKQNYRQALKLLDQALENRPDNPFALNNRALIFMSTGETAKAFADLSASKKLDPKSATNFFLFGQLFQQTNEPQKAIFAYHKSIELDPGIWQAYYNQATILITSLHNKQLALEKLETLLQIPNLAPQVKTRAVNLRDDLLAFE